MLKVDIEYDGLPEETASAPNEENPGGILCLNENDNAGSPYLPPNSGNGTVDTSDPAPLSAGASDPDLQPLYLIVTPNPGQGVVTLTIPSTIRVWADQQKQATPLQWNLALETLPATVFIEGFQVGSGELTLAYNGAVQREDQLLLEVQNCICAKLSMHDDPGRLRSQVPLPGPLTWRATLELVCQDAVGSASYTSLASITYGFDMDVTGNVTLITPMGDTSDINVTQFTAVTIPLGSDLRGGLTIEAEACRCDCSDPKRLRWVQTIDTNVTAPGCPASPYNDPCGGDALPFLDPGGIGSGSPATACP